MLSVTVEKMDVNSSTNEDSFDDRMIADNGKRKYWNVTRDDVLVMNFNFFPNATKRDAELTCFAWCNVDMSDSPPSTKSSDSTIDRIESQLVSLALIGLIFLNFFNLVLRLGS